MFFFSLVDTSKSRSNSKAILLISDSSQLFRFHSNQQGRPSTNAVSLDRVPAWLPKASGLGNLTKFHQLTCISSEAGNLYFGSIQYSWGTCLGTANGNAGIKHYTVVLKKQKAWSSGGHYVRAGYERKLSGDKRSQGTAPTFCLQFQASALYHQTHPTSRENSCLTKISEPSTIEWIQGQRLVRGGRRYIVTLCALIKKTQLKLA